MSSASASASSPSVALHEMTPSEINAKLKHLIQTHNLHRPTRSTIDPTRPWRFETPNYDKADLLYFQGRTTCHPKGSLEDIVENAVKTWEMEASHLHFHDWQTVDHQAYVVSANGGKRYKGDQGAQAGNYNWLLDSCDKQLYNSEQESFESSHQLFRNAFLDGFPWELICVFCGPPRIAFSWRHWGEFNGQFRDRSGDGQVYNMYGWGIVGVDDALRICEIEIFYKPEQFLKALMGGGDGQNGAEALVGSGCPFLGKRK